MPRLPLDVLAQQIVAMGAVETLTVEEIEQVARGAYPFAELSREQLEGVLDMLAGRYPSDEFAELRPRVVWDRAAGTVRGREGARSLAVQNAARSPTAGCSPWCCPTGRGWASLDEEMVYEARAGQAFMLGASTWRIEEITRDRVIVTPAPGAPGALPFWKGEGIGRPYEPRRGGGATRARAGRRRAAAGGRSPAAGEPFEDRAAGNLIGYLEDQAAATGVVPSDRAVVVERFRDEIGDWRLCVLTPFGARVHAPWALALAARLRAATGQQAHAIWGDDGIALHLPDADEAPAADIALIPPDEPRGAGARRASAGRPCSGPASARTRPGRASSRDGAPQRTFVAAAPQGLLAAAGGAALRRLPGDPRDLPRVPRRLVRPAGAARAAGRIASREVAVVRSRRPPPRRSPGRCCSSTSPRTCTRTTRRRPSAARRRCRSTATCCASCWARRSCATSSTPGRSPPSRPTCRASERARARGPDGLHDPLRRIGDLSAGEVATRVAQPERGPRRSPRRWSPTGARSGSTWPASGA